MWHCEYSQFIRWNANKRYISLFLVTLLHPQYIFHDNERQEIKSNYCFYLHSILKPQIEKIMRILRIFFLVCIEGYRIWYKLIMFRWNRCSFRTICKKNLQNLSNLHPLQILLEFTNQSLSHWRLKHYTKYYLMNFNLPHYPQAPSPLAYETYQLEDHFFHSMLWESLSVQQYTYQRI